MATTPTNLYEYFTGKGQVLPSVAERSKLYEQYGLGSATTYGGTAQQNTGLLNKLLAGAPAPAPVVAPTPAPIPNVQQQIAQTQAQLQSNQSALNTAQAAGYVPGTPTGTQQIPQTVLDTGKKTYAFTRLNGQVEYKQMTDQEYNQTVNSLQGMARYKMANEVKPTGAPTETGGGAETPETPETKDLTRDEIYKKYGIDTAMANWSTQPAKSFEDTVQAIFDKMGLVDINKQLADLSAKIAKADVDYAKAVGDINENPWLSESGRVGKVRILQEQYDSTVGRLTANQTSLQNQVNRAKEEAMSYAEAALNANNQQHNLDKERLDMLIARAEADIEAQYQQQQAESEALTAASKNRYTEVSPGASIYDYTTGKTVYTAPKTETGTGASDTAFWSAVDKGKNELQQGEAWGNVWDRIKQQFPNKSDAEIDNALGTSWREPGAFQKFKGLTPSGKNLTATDRAELATMDTAIKMAENLVQLGESTGWSGVGGLYSGSIQQWLAKNFGTGSKEAVELRSIIGNVKGTIAKLRGGTSFTENEQKLLDTYTPGIDDSPMVIMSKVKALTDFVNLKKETVMGGSISNNGTSYTSTSGNTYELPY